ncbi:alanine--tRNA ligase [Bacteroidia bacterium]|nr:alanine--tRNA ligase [Bacteroidia bacterium]
MTANEIRKVFLEFFASKQHHIVESAPMVVKNDPTLMFTNAGMNQFKDVFLGNSPIQHKRVVDSQKCLRVSGKHNDLEEVGHDTYHHTMFEMLGNWSFADYFKKEAIAFAWELLTEVYKIPKDSLYVTIFGGDDTEQLSKDDEAYNYWKTFIAEDRIILGSKKDNFWEMGDTGPCGPCSEIHVDIRSAAEKAKTPGGEMVNQGHPHVIEIWNLVFMQYNRMANGSLVELPHKHVDTGMGFERLCMVLQGKQSNYDTDVFQPIIQRLAVMAGKHYGENTQSDVAMRVVADHLRAVSFAIADGQLPSNNKAGYVIRRILRRSVRYGYTFLGFKTPFMCELVDTLVKEMGTQFDELSRQKDLIYKVILEEESAFLRTLDTGIHLLDQIIAKNKEQGLKTIAGKDAFEAFDTYGFPIDLTQLIAKEQGMDVDIKNYEIYLNQQKERSRNASNVETDDWIELLPITETQFVGYDTAEAKIHILKYRKVTGKNKTFYQLVFDQTPFYAESGGQVGDSGVIQDGVGRETVISDTKKENNLTIHLADTLPEDITGLFTAKINTQARRATMRNHTATHLMHKALRAVLGTHVEQKGSLVKPESLRFDFSHFQKLSDDELRLVEQQVNQMIRRNLPLEEDRRMPIEQARQIGAMALFSEKYGDYVRVVKYGDSIEFCGGTHAGSTGEIGSFIIVSESAIAAGVRRIEAITGKEAETYIAQSLQTLKNLQTLVNDPHVTAAVHKLIEERDTLKKHIETLTQQQVARLTTDLVNQVTTYKTYKIIELHDDTLSADVVRQLSFDFRKLLPNLVFIASLRANKKITLTLTLGDEVVAKGLNASKIIREVGVYIAGSGGGQPFMATAGGTNLNGLQQAVSAIKEKL